MARRLLGIAGMDAATQNPVARRHVLVVVEDPMLSELLTEALVEAGHLAETATGVEALEWALERNAFDAVIIDLDIRARNGDELVACVRHRAPAATVIALLPCGGSASRHEGIPYHLAIEKPTRLSALLSAVSVARPIAGN